MLQHVSIEIPPDEVDRSLEFWRLLGFDEVESPEPLGDAVRWLERGGTQIHLILTAGHTAPVLGHVGVVAPDHADAKQRLREAGFQVEDSRQLWGADRAFANAPGGHRVELMAAPPP
jgi:catechol 2,3-dioxygenase-like lactoylglutathione lyase family enzyme